MPEIVDDVILNYILSRGERQVQDASWPIIETRSCREYEGRRDGKLSMKRANLIINAWLSRNAL